MMCACLAFTAGAQASARSEHCSKVRARYRIYANGDYLWIKGSKHELNFVIDALDRELMKFDHSQEWDAWGNFVLCTDRAIDPLQLSSASDAVWVKVRLKNYSGIRFVQRPR